MGQVCVKACFVTKNAVLDEFVAPIRQLSLETEYMTDESEGEPATKTEFLSLNYKNKFIQRLTGDETIHIAVRQRNIDRMIFLIENNREVINYQTLKTQDTPLHIATSLNDVSMIKLLLLYNANQTIKNKNGDIAQDLCRDGIKMQFAAKKEKLVESQTFAIIMKYRMQRHDVDVDVIDNNDNVNTTTACDGETEVKQDGKDSNISLNIQKNDENGEETLDKRDLLISLTPRSQ